MDSKNLLMDMVEIESIHGNERPFAEYFVKVLDDLDFHDTRIDAVGNVIGRIGEDKPKIMFCGHMDTVGPFVEPRIEDGKIFGRGSVDAKAPLAAMTLAASKYVQNNGVGEILLAGFVEEEKHSKGARFFVKENPQSPVDYVICGEPTNVQTIVNAYRGLFSVDITHETESGHIGVTPGKFKNAFETQLQLYNEFRNFVSETEPEKPNRVYYLFTVDLLASRIGDFKSRSPWDGKVRFEFRMPLPIKTKSVEKYVKKVIQKIPEIKNLEVIEKVEPYEADINSVLANTMRESVKEVRGRFKFIRKGGTGDMNILGNKWNIPILTYGPGDSSLDHTANEYVRIKDIDDSIEILTKTIQKLALYHQK